MKTKFYMYRQFLKNNPIAKSIKAMNYSLDDYEGNKITNIITKVGLICLLTLLTFTVIAVSI